MMSLINRSRPGCRNTDDVIDQSQQAWLPAASLSCSSSQTIGFALKSSLSCSSFTIANCWHKTYISLGDPFLPTSRAHPTPRGLLSPYEMCAGCKTVGCAHKRVAANPVLRVGVIQSLALASHGWSVVVSASASRVRTANQTTSHGLGPFIASREKPCIYQ